MFNAGNVTIMAQLFPGLVAVTLVAAVVTALIIIYADRVITRFEWLAAIPFGV